MKQERMCLFCSDFEECKEYFNAFLRGVTEENGNKNHLFVDCPSDCIRISAKDIKNYL